MSDETQQADEAYAAGGLGELLVRWQAVKERESVVLLIAAVGLLLFPYLFVRAPVISDLLNGYQGLATLVLIWGIFVIGFDLLHGYTGLLSFGHAAFWGTGAYAAGIFSAEVLNLPLAMVVVGTVTAGLLAWVLGYLSLRRGGIYFAILTLAFAQMLFYMSLQPLADLTNGDNGFTSVDVGNLLGFIPLDAGIPVLDTFVGTWLYVFVAGFTLLAIWVAYRVLNSPYGLVFRAIKENEQRVQFIGLNIGRYKLMSFIISGGFAGAAGSLFAIHSVYVPLETLYWTTSGEVVIMSVLGGVGSLFGALFGSFVYLYVENIVSGFPTLGPFWHLILGAVFVLVIVLFPTGIWGGINSLRAIVVRAIRGDSQ